MVGIEEEFGIELSEERGKYNPPLPSIVVTGASSGIGYAIAKELTTYGYRVFGTVRNTEDALRVSEDLGFAFCPIIMDVTDQASIRAAVREVSRRIDCETLDGLINNAGIAIAGPLMHIDLDELRRQLEINVVGQVAVTQAFLPLLGAYHGAQQAGRIINIGSVSGHTVYPFLGAYAASKHSLEALSDALRRELMIYGIDVILMILGAVRTPIWSKAEYQSLLEQYAETDYAESATQMHQMATRLGQEGMCVDSVAKAVRLALESSNPKPRYVIANNWLFGWWLPRRLPTRWMDWAIGKQFGLSRKARRPARILTPAVLSEIKS